jgi:hypothetical protein
MIAVARKYVSKYEFRVERITITIDKETLKKIRAVAGPRGVSKFISQAAQESIGRHALFAWFDEMEAKYPPDPKVREEIYADMEKIFGLPTPPRRPSRAKRTKK